MSKKKTPPTRLSDWPDVVARPRTLCIGGVGGCCVSMYIGKVLGLPETAWRNPSGPTARLERLGVPTNVAAMAVLLNDARLGGNAVHAFDWLMMQLGYEIVEIADSDKG